MLGVEVSLSDIQSQITSFFSIAAVPMIIAAVLALGLISYIVAALKSLAR